MLMILEVNMLVIMTLLIIMVVMMVVMMLLLVMILLVLLNQGLAQRLPHLCFVQVNFSRFLQISYVFDQNGHFFF